MPYRHRRRLVAAIATLPWLICAFAQPAHADGASGPARAASTVAAKQQTLSVQFSAYGQVEPTSIVNVSVVDSGTVSDLHVLPGSVVSAGQVLARLSGPQMHSLLTQRETTLQSAQARLEAATNALAAARSQLATHLTTQQAVDAAASELAAANASVQTAQAQLAETHDLGVVKAPIAGTVVAVQAADGEQAHAGQALLTIQPRGPLWVRAKYYGDDTPALRIGMTGRFAPAGSSAPIPVKVATIAPALGTDGGLQVGLIATSDAHWISGQWGTVTLDGPSTPFVMVPTASLILDRGQWWVLVHTPKGDEPRLVVPGPARGWQTGIVSGLQPGEQVVAQDAFLEYHRGIAQTYQPPD
ncbi:efflux RND transporter periplasmic adaptor subunit [Trinickia dinghuensis]|nr:efflux RND transporter periplasmic adaptor subunit [Trinickia dinghuensis]